MHPSCRCVNRLAVAGCGAFFASASSDETVKVWDCRSRSIAAIQGLKGFRDSVTSVATTER